MYRTLYDYLTDKYGSTAESQVQTIAREYWDEATNSGLAGLLPYIVEDCDTELKVAAFALVMYGLGTHQWEKVKDSLRVLPANGYYDAKRGI